MQLSPDTEERTFMSKIAEAFKNGKAFIPFITCGDPDLDTTKLVVKEMAANGALGSDAFFPFGDNIGRAYKSGVKYIAQPGGSIRDDNVIETCNKRGIAMCFTGMRLFHH